MSIIVLPTDFSTLSTGAVPLARRMAEALDAQIHCLHIVRDAPYYEGLEVLRAQSLPTTDDLMREARQRLADYIDSQLHELRGRVVTVVKIGTPFVQIIRYAREMHAEMIVISTHGHTGLRHVLLGSTTEAVVRQADCPVLSIRSPEMEFEKP
jgi:nucleotide-binding universal stress UspA family protein